MDFLVTGLLFDCMELPVLATCFRLEHDYVVSASYAKTAPDIERRYRSCAVSSRT